MSFPATETRCLDCSDLEVPRECSICDELRRLTAGVNGSNVHGRDSSNTELNGLMSGTVNRSRTVEELAETVLRELNHKGFCIIDHFHKDEMALAMLEEVKQIHKLGLMHNGQLTSSQESSNIRGDQIAWVDGEDENTQNILNHMKRVDMLVIHMNKKITHYNIAGRTKAMVACYPGIPGEGKRYVKHVDNPHQDGRCITTLYYLNKDYDVMVHGGALRLYPGNTDRFIDIEPILDRFLIFWSDRRNPHEVLPAFRTRYAITLWYFDQDERNVEAERLRKLQESKVGKEKGAPFFIS